MNHHASAPLALALGAALSLACPGASQDCTPGTDACVCDAADTCLPGLICIGGTCEVELHNDTTVEPTSEPPPDGTSTTNPDPSNTTPPDPDTTTPDPTNTTPPDPATSTPDPSTTTTTEPVDPGTTTGTTTTEDPDPTVTTSTGDVVDGITPVLVAYEFGEFGEAHDVEFTPDGDLAVVGYVDRVDNLALQAWMAVMTTEGDYLWERLHNGELGNQDMFHAVAVDPAGRITAVGQTDLSVAHLNIIRITWDADGNELELDTHGHFSNWDDRGYGVAVDPEGNPFVCAYESPQAQQQQAWVVRYDDFSGQYWNKFGGADDVIYDCELTASGHLITVATNASKASIHLWDGFSGDTLYRVDYEGPNATSTWPHGVTVGDGAVYAVGSFHVGLSYGPFITRFSGGGLTWERQPTVEGDGMYAEDAVVDATGYLRVISNSVKNNKFSVFILTYDTEGNELDRTHFDPPETEVKANGLTTRDNRLFVVGGTTFTNSKILLAEFAW